MKDAAALLCCSLRFQTASQQHLVAFKRKVQHFVNKPFSHQQSLTTLLWKQKLLLISSLRPWQWKRTKVKLPFFCSKMLVACKSQCRESKYIKSQCSLQPLKRNVTELHLHYMRWNEKQQREIREVAEWLQQGPEVSPAAGCDLSVRPCPSPAASSAPSAADCEPISPSGPAAGPPPSRLSLPTDTNTHTQTDRGIQWYFDVNFSFVLKIV